MDFIDFHSFYFQDPRLALIFKFKYDIIMGHHTAAEVSALFFKDLYSLWPYLKSDYYWMEIYNKQIISKIHYYSIIEPYNLKYFDICYPWPNHQMATYSIMDVIKLKMLHCPNEPCLEFCDKLAYEFAIKHKGSSVVGSLWFFPDSNPYGPSW